MRQRERLQIRKGGKNEEAKYSSLSRPLLWRAQVPLTPIGLPFALWAHYSCTCWAGAARGGGRGEGEEEGSGWSGWGGGEKVGVGSPGSAGADSFWKP